MPHELSAARRLAPIDHETDRRLTALSLTCLTVPWLLLASTDIFHEDVRGWIVALKNDGACFEPPSTPRIPVGLSLVRPVGHLKSVHPHGNVWPCCDDRFGEPFEVVCVDAFCGRATKDPASPTVNGPGTIILLELILNLAFVAVHQIAWNAAKEDS